MAKGYKDRSMKIDTARESALEATAWFFPKSVPPMTIMAHTREEAEAQLEAITALIKKHE